MIKINTVTGQCPHFKNENSITIEYQNYSNCGDSKTYYSKGNFKCSKIPECTYRDEDNECPIYLKAPETF